MANKGKTGKKWQWITLIIVIGLLINFFLYLNLHDGKIAYANSSAPNPANTILSIELISLTAETATPFQPLPTDTPTPTPTPKPTTTPTRTPAPTNTKTPVPIQSSEDGLPESMYLSGINGYNQQHLLSCESRSAVDWAAYYGVSISENEFLNNLPVSDDPDSGFVGNPDGAEGQVPPNPYGIHADPVAELLRSYGVKAKAIHGLSFSDLRSEIASGNPVIVWVYGNVWTGASQMTYTALSGHSTTVIPFEHTVIAIGYDDAYIYILDGGMIYARTNQQFKNSWSSLGNMSIVAQ